MSETTLAKVELTREESKVLEAVVVGGDLKPLNPAQRMAWYQMRCESAGLDMRTQPFEYIVLNGKLTLYAKKGAADQIASNRGLSTEILSKEIDDYITVQVRVSDASGRFTDDVGMVPTPSERGEKFSNAVLKAVSKAKRRAILSHCGLGMLDETEVETIPGAFVPRPEPVAATQTIQTPITDSASKELRDEYESIRLRANEMGFRTPKGNPAPPLADGATERDARAKINLLTKWLKENAVQDSPEPEGPIEGEVVPDVQAPSPDKPATDEQRVRWAELAELAPAVGIEAPPPWPELITEKDAAERIEMLDRQITEIENGEMTAASS